MPLYKHQVKMSVIEYDGYPDPVKEKLEKEAVFKALKELPFEQLKKAINFKLIHPFDTKPTTPGEADLLYRLQNDLEILITSEILIDDGTDVSPRKYLSDMEITRLQQTQANFDLLKHYCDLGYDVYLTSIFGKDGICMTKRYSHKAERKLQCLQIWDHARIDTTLEQVCTFMYSDIEEQEASGNYREIDNF